MMRRLVSLSGPLAALAVLFGGCAKEPVRKKPQPAAAKKGPAGKKEVAKKLPRRAREGGAQPGPGPVRPARPLNKFEEKLQEIARRKLIGEQEKMNVAEHLYRMALKNYRLTRYDESHQDLLKALEYNPGHVEARKLLRMVKNVLGFKPDEVRHLLTQETRRIQVKITQNLVEASNQVRFGQEQEAKRNYDQAIRAYETAREIVRWLPFFTPTKPELSKRIAALLVEARRRKVSWEEELKRRRRIEARKEAEVQEKKRRQLLQLRIAQLFRKANLQFQRENYLQARALSDQILILDPVNAQAKKLSEIARQAELSKSNSDLNRQYVREWKATFDYIVDMTTYQSSLVRYPSLETWKLIESRPKVGDTADDQGAALSEEERRILGDLEKKQVTNLNFDGQLLPEIISFLQSTYNINIVIHPSVIKGRSEDELKVDIRVRNLSLRQALDLILSLNNLAFKVENGVIVIKDKKQVEGKALSKIYQVQDLVINVQDFPGVVVDLIKGGKQVGTQFQDQEAEKQKITTESIKTLIENNIGKGTWTDKNTITPRAGNLIIRNTPAVHAEIVRLLKQLRQSTGLMVNIETRFITVRDDFLEDVGVDFRGVGTQSPRGTIANATQTVTPRIAATDRRFGATPNVSGGTDRPMDDVLFGVPQAGVGTDNSSGLFYTDNDSSDIRNRVEHLFQTALGSQTILTNSGGLSLTYAFLDAIQVNAILRAVQKSDRMNLLTSPSLTAFNTQRANVSVINQVSYIKDFDVQVAQNATIADPIIGTVQDGVVLDVRPVISSDRRLVTLELRPAVAELTRPIRTFAATLANNAVPVNIQLPEINLRKVETTVTIPDGGTLLLAGMTRYQEQDQQSKVPFVGNIPILSFFFSRKQRVRFQEHLLIMVRARIIDLTELEPKLGLRK